MVKPDCFMQAKQQFPILPILLVGFVVSIVFFQYQFYRTPIKSKPDKNISESNQEATSEFFQKSSVYGGVLKDGIPAIDKPKFESVNDSDSYLNDDGYGIAISQKGSWRFYPYQILVWHHIVNDQMGGVPLLISFNPLAFVGEVFVRTINGTVYQFGLSDRVYNNSLLLYDHSSQSLWDPILHQAIIGEMSGTQLMPYSSIVMTWKEFKIAHPSAQVFSRETGFERDYTFNPYAEYESDFRVLFPLTYLDDRLAAKDLVYGIKTNSGWMAYPADAVEKNMALKDDLLKQNAVLMYWFAWNAAHSKTDLFQEK